MSYNPHFLLAGILFCNISLWMQAAGPTWQTTSEFFSSPRPFLPPHRWCREVMACSSCASPPLSKVLGRPASIPSQYWAFPKNPTVCLIYHVLAWDVNVVFSKIFCQHLLVNIFCNVFFILFCCWLNLFQFPCLDYHFVGSENCLQCLFIHFLAAGNILSNSQ